MKTVVDNDGNTNWIFTQAELRALLAHCSKDDTRPGYAALHLDTELGRAWTTDGHRAAIAITKDRVDHDRAIRPKDGRLNARGINIARGDVEHALNIGDINRGDITITPRLSGGFPLKVTFSGLSSAVGGELIVDALDDAMCPNIDQATPRVGGKNYTGVASSFSGKYLEDANKIVKALPVRVEKRGRNADKTPEPITIYPPPDQFAPTTLKAGSILNQTDWTVLIMPVRL